MHKLVTAVLLVLLAGCWKVGPDYQKPIIDTPKKWRFGEQDARDLSNAQWWGQLGDPVLNRLVGQALKGNYDLKIAVASVDSFMGAYGSTRSSLFPQIAGFGEYARRQTSGQIVNLSIAGVSPGGQETDYARLGTQMNWELDIWGQLRRANEAAFADMLSQQAVQRGVILTLVSDVATTYIQLRTFDKSLEITRNVVDTLTEGLRIAKLRFQEGYTSELEVTQADSELQRRKAQIPIFEKNIAETEHALSILLGRNPGAIQRGLTLDELKLPTVPAGLPSDLLVRRPDIDLAEQRLIAANARIGVARGNYFPKISLTGDVGQMGTQMATLFTPGANFWTLGANMALPIFTAGKIAGQVQSAEAEQRGALANYQRSIISAFRDFENSLIDTIKTKEQRDSQVQRVAAVDTYFKLSKIRYDEGYTDYITYLDSVRQLFDAQIDLVQAQSDTFIASIGLYRAMGGGWIVKTEETTPIPKPQDPVYIP
jgi:multidrug efflux system outer membrane protein